MCIRDRLGISLTADNAAFLTVTKDDEGRNIETRASEDTFVLIEFAEDGTLSVKVKVRPWGEANDHIEF